MMRWYKRDGDEFAGGTVSLTLEEVGAYSLILDAIYSLDDQLPDDDFYVARLLRCDPRVWRRIRGRLIALGKLTIVDGYLCNERATYEVSRAIGAVHLHGKIGRTLDQKLNKINGATPVRARARSKNQDIKLTLGETKSVPPAENSVPQNVSDQPAAGPATALCVESAPSRLPTAAANGGDPSRPFTRAEVGKPNGWEWVAPKPLYERIAGAPPPASVSRADFDALITRRKAAIKH